MLECFKFSTCEPLGPVVKQRADDGPCKQSRDQVTMARMTVLSAMRSEDDRVANNECEVTGS